MEMQQVRYFLSVARTLNFTRAAEQCHVSQPALTRAIKQLEHELGGELIRREGRLSHLTDLGQRMLPLLQQCYDSAQAAKAVAGAVKRGDVARLTLACSSTLDVGFLMPAIAEIFRAFPGIQFRLRRGSASDTAGWLKQAEVDLAIAGTDPDQPDRWDRLDSWPLFTESFGILIGSGHPLATADRSDIDVEAIRAERLFVHSDIFASARHRERLDSLGIDIDGSHQVDQIRDLEALVAADFGIGVVPASALAERRLRHLRCEMLGLSRTVAIYSVAGRSRSREATTLLNLLRASAWTTQPPIAPAPPPDLRAVDSPVPQIATG